MPTNNPAGWQKKGELLSKEFGFKDFAAAIKFVNEVAKIAESQNHHPDILIHSYKKVRITTYTHEAGQVTEKDMKLAKSINDIPESA